MWLYTCGSQDCSEAVSNGTLSFEANGLVPGVSYQAYLLCCDGYSAIDASQPFEISPTVVPGTNITTDKTEYSSGEAITVLITSTVSSGWVGIWPSG